MQPRNPLVGLLAAMLLGTWAGEAALAQGDAGVRARGDTFSLPVPRGYSVSRDARVTQSVPGGVVLAGRRPEANHFIGSVIVARIGAGPQFDPGDPVFCKQAAEVTVAESSAVLRAHRIVRTAVGNTCQWETVDKELSTHGTTGTIMYKARENSWVVTCNFDVRDAPSRAACAEVLEGWKFD